MEFEQIEGELVSAGLSAWEFCGSISRAIRERAAEEGIELTWNQESRVMLKVHEQVSEWRQEAAAAF